jgi:hypothetical protein
VKTPFLLVLAGILSLPVAAQGPERVVTVVGVAITRGELTGGAHSAPREARLLDLVWPRIAGDYVKRQGLAATPAEIDEATAYHREFERRSRIQRARKLQELEERLAEPELAPEERERLEDFQATLRRLAEGDSARDGASQDPERLRVLLVPLVEMWKLNRAIYERFGGVVALTEFGPSPLGARADLIADYERQGRLEFADAGLRERFYAILRQPPPMVVPPGRVDFTPYWKRPIPPSYYPD